MGTYDEVYLNGITWQTKALGKTLQRRVPGSPVEVQRVASTDDPEGVRSYTYDDLPRRYLVQVQAVEYALVEDGHIVGLATAADRDALINDMFDYYGRDEADELTRLMGGDPAYPPRPMTPVIEEPRWRSRRRKRDDVE